MESTFTRAYAANTIGSCDGVVSFEPGRFRWQMRHVSAGGGDLGRIAVSRCRNRKRMRYGDVQSALRRDCPEAAVVGRVAESSRAEIGVFA